MASPGRVGNVQNVENVENVENQTQTKLQRDDFRLQNAQWVARLSANSDRWTAEREQLTKERQFSLLFVSLFDFCVDVALFPKASPMLGFSFSLLEGGWSED